MKHGLVNRLESILCRYLGINHNDARAETVRLVSNKIIVNSMFSYKRHIIKETLEDFFVNESRNDTKRQIGIAVGKVLAKNLVINFDTAELELMEKKCD